MNKIYVFILLSLACLKGFSQSWNPAPYCAPITGSWSIPCAQPAPSNDPSNFINDFVNSFTTTGAVTDINNMNSGCCGLPNNYIFYCNHPLVVTAGQTLTLSVQSASTWAGGFAIFIDWNQDNIFQTPSEKVANTPGTVPGGAWASMTITIPPTQPNGVYRMRVREIWAIPGNGIHPCNMAGYGETEDYNVYIGTVPPPASVVSATASPNQTVCLGQNANLNVSYTGTTSTTFDWGGPNSFTSSIQNPTVVNTTTASNGFYYVSLGTSTCPVMAVTHVYVNPGPQGLQIVSSNSVICSGASATLTAYSANNYTWVPGSSTNTSIVVTPSSTSVYTVIGTATNNACPGQKTYTLTVNQGPPVNISSSHSVICSGSSATLTASGSNTYTWTPGSSTNTTLIVTPAITTVYTVASTGTNNCVGKHQFTLTVNTCAGLNEWNATNGIGFIYPNPFDDELKIKTTGLLEIKITNALGEIVLEKSVVSDESIDVSKLSKGVYLLFISNGTGISAIKIVKH